MEERWEGSQGQKVGKDGRKGRTEGQKEGGLKEGKDKRKRRTAVPHHYGSVAHSKRT